MRGIKPVYKAAIVRLLGNGNMSVEDIAQRVPCSMRTAYDIVKSLRKTGQAYVSAYKPSKTKPIMVVQLGNGVDALPLLPSLGRVAKHRKKMSADDKDFLNARRRQRNRKIKIDPLIAAFFGGMK
jgi:hypothetical protein